MPTAQPISIRGAFLAALIASLSVSALIAIFAFLLGDFGETEIRLLITTLTIGGYSLTGLCGSVLYDRREYIPLAFAGIMVSITGFLFTVGAIWFYDSDEVWNWVAIFAILAFSIAHSSLLFFARSDKNLVNYLLTATIASIVIVALMLIHLVFDDVDEFYFRLLGVFAVLDVLGTIVTPILRKFILRPPEKNMRSPLPLTIKGGAAGWGSGAISSDHFGFPKGLIRTE